MEVELCTYKNLHCYLTSMKGLVLSGKHRLGSRDSGKEITHGVEYSCAVLRFVAGPWSKCDVELLDTLNLWPQPRSAITTGVGLVHRLGNEVIMSEVRMVCCSTIQTHHGIHSLTLLLLLKIAMEFGVWGMATGSELNTVMTDPVANCIKKLATISGGPAGV
jgi:hypothetical protein